ncbi:MAG: hypothetical protein LBI39_03810 [Puniceicoccales bacterium]|jgi:hypothetical protein|nr:hypothetical protein [Puniceicoccales bacterium]
MRHVQLDSIRLFIGGAVENPFGGGAIGVDELSLSIGGTGESRQPKLQTHRQPRRWRLTEALRRPAAKVCGG